MEPGLAALRKTINVQFTVVSLELQVPLRTNSSIQDVHIDQYVDSPLFLLNRVCDNCNFEIEKRQKNLPQPCMSLVALKNNVSGILNFVQINAESH